MKATSKRLLSCVLAFTLLVTCTLAGLVLPASAADYAAVGTNIATNGDFETTDGTQWTNASPYGAKDGVGFGGSRGLELTADKKTLYYRTTLTFRPNAVYEVSFVAKGRADLSGSIAAARTTRSASISSCLFAMRSEPLTMSLSPSGETLPTIPLM